MRPWGLLPEDIRKILKQKEWDRPSRLRGRLSGARPFPIRIPLKPPTGVKALEDIGHFHHFIQVWKDWPQQQQIQWQVKQYRQLDRHEMPVMLQLDSIQALIEYVGPKAVARSRRWERLMAPVLAIDRQLYPILVRYLDTLEKMQAYDTQWLAELLPQLQPGMGKGTFLRALPLRGVDTKFVENHFHLISDLMESLTQGQISQSGGLLSWLNCRENPKGWLMVRPLCAKTQAGLNDLPLMQLPTNVLLEQSLPSAKILVVENTQTGYSLPELSDTIAVIGGGRNTAWMAAPWLQNKQLAYWGDLDTWGFAILGQARGYQPQLTALLMDRETLMTHKNRMATEPEPYPQPPQNLTEQEQKLLMEIRDGVHGHTRLEQERISPDYALQHLTAWSEGNDPPW